MCNVNTANWPADTVAACNAQVSGGMAYEVSFTARRRIQLCGSDACMAIERLMKAANPTECSFTYQGTEAQLYSGIITPLEQTCRQVMATTATETPSQSPPRPSSGDNSSISSSPDLDPPVGGIVPGNKVTPGFSSSQAGAVVAATAGVLLVLLVALCVFLRKRRKKLDHPTHLTAVTMNTWDQGYGEPVNDFMSLLRPLINWKMVSGDLTDVKCLGCGSHAAVYLVTFDGGRQLASKRLAPDQYEKAKLVALIVEAQLVATLQHPSIVAFVGVAWSSPFDFQVLFDYMGNGDLRTYLDLTKPLQPQPWTLAKTTTALQIAEGLAYLHSFNPPIVHGDLKTRSILLDAEMNAKLSGFSVPSKCSEHHKTMTGLRVSRWHAPELTGGAKYTAQCDIYSFGVIMVEMAAHGLPHGDFHHVAEGTLQPQISPTCQTMVRSLIEVCLSSNAGDRPTALRLTHGLRKILKGL